MYGYVKQSEIVSSMFFAAGVGTFLQTAIGSRLPILEGASFTFVTPAVALLTNKNYQCYGSQWTCEPGQGVKCDLPSNSTETEDIWLERMQVIQVGADCNIQSRDNLLRED